MVQRCAVLGCNTTKAGDGISLHGFPLEPGLRSSWLRALFAETGQTVREEDQICSKHFTPDCFEYVNGLAVLKIEAVPFRNCSTNVETPTSSKRARLEEICFESQKRNKRSFVWEYFTRQNETIATCHLCNKELKYFGSTSNLREHMKRIHPGLIDIENIPSKDNSELTQNCNNPSSPHLSLTADFDRIDIKEQLSKWTSKKAIITRTTVFSGKEKEDIDMSLVKMLVVDYQPLRMVADPGFQAFIRKLQPWYTLPTKEILSSEIIPSLYEKMNGQLRHLISDVSKVAISAEIWMHTNRTQYLTLTSHFICEGQMINAVFATKKLPTVYTIEYIRSLIHTALNEWEIQHKVVCIVTDCEIVVQAILSKQFVLRHQLCIAYTLNLCLHEVLNSTDAIKKLLHQCKKIVQSFKLDRKAVDVLIFNDLNKEPHRGASELGSKNNASYVNWQDILKIFQKLIKHKERLQEASNSETFRTEPYCEIEWTAINELVGILKLIEDFANELSSTKYPPVSSIIPLTRCLRHAVEARNLLTDVGKSFQINLCNTLSQRLGGFENDLIFSKATFLDPRFKKAGFGSVNHAEKAQQEIINELSTMMVENVLVEYSSIENQSTDENDIWAHFDQKVAQLKSSTTPKSNAELIVKHYIEVPLIPRAQDPFEYWDINKDVFPELYKLHIKYCCCPATSVAPETLFTKQGKIIKDRKTRLSESSLEKMIFLNGNIILFN